MVIVGYSVYVIVTPRGGGGVARYCFDPVCLSVCMYVCVCESGQYFGILFLGY